MAKRTSSVILACVTVILCACLIVGGTLAMFSDEEKLTVNLQAGSLDASLTRTKLTTKTLDEQTGKLVEKTVEDDVDFTQATAENIFGIKQGSKIVPGCEFTAEMLLQNNGSLAFTYEIEVVFDQTSDAAFAEQIEVKAKLGNTEKTASFREGGVLKIDNLPTLDKNSAQSFSVTVKFIDSQDNNLAQNKTVKFDLIVRAVQAS